MIERTETNAIRNAITGDESEARLGPAERLLVAAIDSIEYHERALADVAKTIADLAARINANPLADGNHEIETALQQRREYLAELKNAHRTVGILVQLPTVPDQAKDAWAGQ